MSIVLVTGTPGAGKTLWSVRELITEYLPSGRAIYHNIDGLDVGDHPNAHNVHVISDDDVLRWPDFPDHSIFFFDECQRQFPRRNPMSKTPPYIEGFETHRHHGLDFFLITQGPMLIDTHIHPLVERHVHLYRPYGLNRSSIFTWNTVNPQPNPRQSRATSQRENFWFPKAMFKHYKSASHHTVKRRTPWMLLGALPACAAVVVLCVVVIRSTFGAMANGADVPVDVVELVDLGPPEPERCLSVVSRLGSSALVTDGVARFLLPLDEVREMLGGTPVLDGAGLEWVSCASTGTDS